MSKSKIEPITNRMTGTEFCKKNGPVIITRYDSGKIFFTSSGSNPIARSGYIAEAAAEIIHREMNNGGKLKNIISTFLEFAVVNYVDDDGKKQSCPTLMPKSEGKILYGLEDWSDDYEEEDDEKEDDDVEKEICELVAFFRDMHFTRSSQISKYITENKLGYKYPNISGILEMTNGYETWDFEGGIHPKHYAEICRRLNLEDNNAQSWVEDFKSYKELLL